MISVTLAAIATPGNETRPVTPSTLPQRRDGVRRDDSKRPDYRPWHSHSVTDGYCSIA